MNKNSSCYVNKNSKLSQFRADCAAAFKTTFCFTPLFCFPFIVRFAMFSVGNSMLGLHCLVLETRCWVCNVQCCKLDDTVKLVFPENIKPVLSSVFFRFETSVAVDLGV